MPTGSGDRHCRIEVPGFGSALRPPLQLPTSRWASLRKSWLPLEVRVKNWRVVAGNPGDLFAIGLRAVAAFNSV